jgi:hypothetical protein
MGPDSPGILEADIRKYGTSCYRDGIFSRGVMERVVLHLPSPAQDAAASRKCFAANFAEFAGLIGEQADGDTVTNEKNERTTLSGKDKFVLSVIYDPAFRAHQTLQGLRDTISEVLKRKH